MSLPASAAQALDEFNACTGWESRARLLLQWAARLDALPAAQCIAANQVHGCESQVWLLGNPQQGHWQFQAASEARLLRGLLALLLARVNGLSATQLAGVDLADWFNQLGLSRQLSPSRSNGLQAVLQRMHELAGGPQ